MSQSEVVGSMGGGLFLLYWIKEMLMSQAVVTYSNPMSHVDLRNDLVPCHYVLNLLPYAFRFHMLVTNLI